jgi:hypothetical protein
MKINDNLTQVFDLEPTEYTEIPSKTKKDIIVKDNKPDVIENDYENVRDNLYDLLSTGTSALEDMLEVAKQSEHPRAYEVVGNLMKQLADMNQQLLDIHQQKQKLEAPYKKEQASQVTNNNAIFVGSTNDLAKMIQNMNNGEK